MATYQTGALYSSTLPTLQRNYYESLLMQTVRTKSLWTPFCAAKEDFGAKQTGQITYSEVFDTDPNFSALAETSLFLTGAYLDSRSVLCNLEIHGDVVKWSDYNEMVTYVNNGDLRGLMKDKIGQNLVDTLDILARNAHLAHPYPVYAGGVRTTRVGITATDYFNPDFGELARTHLEEKDIPGVIGVDDNVGPTIACITTPRVIHDIRTAAGSKWYDVNMYSQTGRKFTNEVGMWAGVRYVRTNRNVLRNAGAVINQSTLSASTVVGQGASATVDVVYSVGQSAATKYVSVALGSGFAVGDIVTIHDVALNGGAGNPPLETDGTIEHRRITAISTNNISFDKPLLKVHTSGALVTKGRTLHASVFMGGTSVVWAVGERPTPTMPPKWDDLQMINRMGWRGFFKFQQFRPEFTEVHLTAGTID